MVSTMYHLLSVAIVMNLVFRFVSSESVLGGENHDIRGKNEFGLERSINMIGGGCSDVEWTVDLETLKWTVAVRGAPDSDWVAIGLSENGGMKGADLILVQRKHSGSDEFVASDLISRDFVRPEKDILQNVKLVSAYEDDQGGIRALLERPLDSCDSDDIKVKRSKQSLICASGMLDAEGQILYHGRSRSRAQVNLMVDAALLFDRRFHFDKNASRIEIASGITVNGDVETSEPLPVDIQLKDVTIDRTSRTSYRCAVIEVPMDANVIAVDAVWGDGITTEHEPQPSFIHHQLIYRCDNPELMDPSTFDGVAYDCFENMPPCDGIFAHAQSGLMQTPHAVHVPMRKGIYVLTVHYENPLGQRIDNDRAGVRLWIEPPTLTSRTTAGQMLQIYGQHQSIHIPASPQPQEYPLEFQISADATRAVLPPNGVEIFTTHVHMHETAQKARVKLIRDGVHIKDVLKTKSHDFNLEAPVWGLWRLLPGDALIVTCTYQSLPGKDVNGGWSTKDEMCVLLLGIAPEVPGLDFAVGYMVRPAEPFLNSYAGPANGLVSDTLDYSKAIYPPNPGRDYIPLVEHKAPLCELFVHEALELPAVRFSSAEIPALLYIIAAFVFCYLALFVPQIRDMKSERKQRNTVVYLIQLVFSTLAFPLLLWQLIVNFRAAASYDAVNPSTFSVARGLITVQTVLYLLELFYRIRPRWEVILHHLITSSVVIFINYVGQQTLSGKLCVQLGIALALMAVTEQPFYIALLLKNFGYAGAPWWPALCRFAGWSFLVCKLIFIGLAATFLARSSLRIDASWEIRSHSYSEWANGGSTISEEAFIAVISISMALLLVVQVFITKVMLDMASKHEKEQKDTFVAGCKVDQSDPPDKLLEATDDSLLEATRHSEGSDGSSSDGSYDV